MSRPGVKIDPDHDTVVVDGTLLRAKSSLHYYIVNKPAGYVTTVRDPEGRPTVMQLVPGGERLYPVGRLDQDSDGLVLITDDGDLAHLITHPRYGVPKVYLAFVLGRPDHKVLERLRQGVLLEDGPTAPAGVRLVESGRAFLRLPKVIAESMNPGETLAILEIELKEGRKRQVRRMCEAVGHPVLTLTRIAIGPVRLGTLQPGRFRRLVPSEVESLRAYVQGRRSDPHPERGSAHGTRS